MLVVERIRDISHVMGSKILIENMLPEGTAKVKNEGCQRKMSLSVARFPCLFKKVQGNHFIVIEKVESAIIVIFLMQFPWRAEF